jgi:hypothetical protein
VQDASQEIYKAAQDAQASGGESGGNTDSANSNSENKEDGPIIDAEVVEEKKE